MTTPVGEPRSPSGRHLGGALAVAFVGSLLLQACEPTSSRPTATVIHGVEFCDPGHPATTCGQPRRGVALGYAVRLLVDVEPGKERLDSPEFEVEALGTTLVAPHVSLDRRETVTLPVCRDWPKGDEVEWRVRVRDGGGAWSAPVGGRWTVPSPRQRSDCRPSSRP